MQVDIRFKNNIIRIEPDESEKVIDIKIRLATNFSITPNQIRLEIISDDQKKVVLMNDSHIRDFKKHCRENVLHIMCKDLGSQISYSYLFYIEYCFPPLAALGFYIANLKKVNRYHSLLTGCVVFHFLKRILETRFVHIFSNPSVPLKILLRNCLHYWALLGVLLPLEIFHLRKMSFGNKLSMSKRILFVLFLVFEYLNYVCHVKLRKLRERGLTDGKTKIVIDRQIPRGLFFDSVISPNYTFEILSWVSFTALFESYVAGGFTLISAYIMTQWAMLKKKRYLEIKEISDFEKEELLRKKVTIPFVI